jgi:hypothetical protein
VGPQGRRMANGDAPADKGRLAFGSPPRRDRRSHGDHSGYLRDRRLQPSRPG